MTEEAKKDKIRWFKSPKQVGEIRLLPSDIDSRVLIRKPKMARSGGYGSCHDFSVVCILNSRKRTINTNSIGRDIDIPPLVFQYDYNSLELNKNRNIGYLYRCVKHSDEKVKDHQPGVVDSLGLHEKYFPEGR